MSKFARVLTLIIIAALTLTACAQGGGSQATPTTSAGTGAGATDAPAATEPVATEAPAATEPAATEAATEPAGDATPTAEVTETPAAGGEATAAVTPTVTPMASVEGTLTIWADAERVPVITDLGKQFTEKYNVPVAVQEMGFGDIRNQLVIAGPAGEGPDIIIGAHDWLGELMQNGLLEPIDLAGKEGSFDPVAIEAFTYNGELVGMPYATESVALIYNKDLVPTPPKTWEELKTIAKQLQDEGKVDQGYVLQQADAYHFNPMLTGFGGYIFGTNEQGYNPEDVGLDSPGGLAAAKELDAMVKAGLLRQDVNYDIMSSLFNQGKSAMMIGGPWMLTDIKAAGINYGIAPIPTMAETPKPFVGVQGFMISSFGKNKLLAQSFLNEYLATDEAMQAIYEAGLRAPAWTSLRESIEDPDLKAFAESGSNGQPMPAIPEMSAVWEALNDAITIVFQQQQDPEQAFKDAAQTIRERIAAGN